MHPEMGFCLRDREERVWFLFQIRQLNTPAELCPRAQAILMSHPSWVKTLLSGSSPAHRHSHSNSLRHFTVFKKKETRNRSPVFTMANLRCSNTIILFTWIAFKLHFENSSSHLETYLWWVLSTPPVGVQRKILK